MTTAMPATTVAEPVDPTSFWDDGRYRSASNGYRSHYGSKAEYSRGFRAGYEQGYWERRGGRGRY